MSFNFLKNLSKLNQFFQISSSFQPKKSSSPSKTSTKKLLQFRAHNLPFISKGIHSSIFLSLLPQQGLPPNRGCNPSKQGLPPHGNIQPKINLHNCVNHR